MLHVFRSYTILTKRGQSSLLLESFAQITFSARRVCELEPRRGIGGGFESIQISELVNQQANGDIA